MLSSAFSFLVFCITSIFSIVVGIIVSIIQGIPLFKMAKSRGLNNPWLAFIPIGYLHIILNLPVGDFKVLGIKFNRSTALLKLILLMILITFLSSFLMMSSNSIFSLYGYLLSFFYFVFCLVFSFKCIKDVLQTYSVGNVTLWTLLCFFPGVFIIVMYLIMNRTPNVYSSNNC